MATDWVTEYHNAIERGEVTVGAMVRTIYKRLADEIAADDGPWRFDAKRGNAPILFASRFCRHSKGAWAGKPFEMELWQKALTCALFGFVDRQTGYRRFNELFLAVGRKSGKSTWAAAILLYVMVCEGKGQDVYSLASKYDQAALIFNEAQAMVDQSPMLRKRMRKRRTDLYMPGTRSTFRPLGRNTNGSMDGLNASAACVDECHALSGTSGREMYSSIKLSMGAVARPEPILLVTTTAGTLRCGLFDDLFDLAKKVIDGTIQDPHFLPVVYMLDDAEAEWDKEEAWYKACPSLQPQGNIKKLEDMRAKCQRALTGDPAIRTEFLSKDLDVISTSVTTWLDYHEVYNLETFDLEDFSGTWAIGGVDLSQTTDLTAACILMYRAGTFYAWPMFWLPEDNVTERIHMDQIPYDVWHDRGLVRYCKGNVIDPSDVTAWFLEVVNEHGISVRWVGYDPYCSRYWTTEMEQYGFDMVRVRQGHATESVPLQNMGQLFKAHKINYDNNPVLLWNLTNAGVEVSRNNTIALVKAGQPRQRIDGVAALMDAFVVYYDHAGEFLQLCGEE